MCDVEAIGVCGVCCPGDWGVGGRSHRACGDVWSESSRGECPCQPAMVLKKRICESAATGRNLLMSRSKRGSTGLVDTPEYWDALAQEYTDKVCSSYDDCATNAVRDALDSVACPSAVAVDFGTGPGKVRRDGRYWEACHDCAIKAT